ncbi:AraC family transcriptional regulator [Phocaeicola dorei]|uniref:AraC family transcriptional regulator n=4 Tax=Bacteroidaceae TaxID=815 RepID=A0AA37NKL7_9BACT|nr:AraC family transcriptional regulator [Phocaeicola dorei]GKH82707.1 AraC family transcriptional regulator [Phocaeicola dorei]
MTNKFGICPSTGHLSVLFPEKEAERTPSNKIFLAIVLQGGAMIEIDGKNHLIYTGTLIYLYPNHLVRQISHTEDLLLEYLWFEFEFLSDFPLLLKADISEYVGKNPCLQLKDKERQLVKKYYDLIAERYQESNEYIAITKGLLFSFILEISRLYSGKNVSVSNTRQDELTDHFFFLLHQHYKKERSVSFYADKLYISDKYLMRVLKKSTGQTFHFWVIEFIMREAKLLLRSTTISITEISEKLNYPNPSIFSRVFHQYVGMTPKEFRNQ